MAASDVLIGRAGATFLAEAAVLSNACIIIPAAHLSGGHQVENANVLAKSNAVRVIEDSNLSEDSLKQATVELLSDPRLRIELGAKLHSLERTDAATAIAELLMA